MPNEIIKDEVSVDLEKRKFIGKFGKYAIVGAGMATLMTPNASASGNNGVDTGGDTGGGDTGGGIDCLDPANISLPICF